MNSPTEQEGGRENRKCTSTEFSFNTHNHPQKLLLLSPFHRWEKLGLASLQKYSRSQESLHLSLLSATWGHESAFWNLEEGCRRTQPGYTKPDLGLPDSRTRRNQSLLFISPSVYGGYYSSPNELAQLPRGIDLSTTRPPDVAPPSRRRATQAHPLLTARDRLPSEMWHLKDFSFGNNSKQVNQKGPVIT